MSLNDEQLQMVEDCVHRQCKLSEREEKFIIEVYSRHEKMTLTNKQIAWLERIWKKVT